MHISAFAIDESDHDLRWLSDMLADIPDMITEFHGFTDPDMALWQLKRRSDVNVAFVAYMVFDYPGVEIVRRMREGGFEHPIILLAAAADVRSAVDAMRQGASDFQVKDSLSPESLRDSVVFVIERYQRERQQSEALRRSMFDDLTGLYRRAYFEERANHEIDRARRYGKPLSLMMLDLDHFKSVNDTKGHVVGDTVLKETGHCIIDALRSSDVAGRFGGEEFCILLPETAPDNARILADRLRKRISERVFTWEKGDFQVTASIGVAGITPLVRKLADFVEIADKALYHAKHSGRNRVVASGMEDAGPVVEEVPSVT